jgi:hypothetical protein
MRELKLGHLPPPPAGDERPSDPVLGCMRDDAELMDEIVADAYRRRQEPWREAPVPARSASECITGG